MNNVIEASDINFDMEVKRSTIPVLVFFYSPNCGYCRMQWPIIKEFAKEFQSNLRIVAVDITKNLQKTTEYKVSGVPSFIVFINGKPINEFSGFTHKHRLEEIIKYYYLAA